MSRDDILRFLKEQCKTTLTFNRYNYKGSDLNLYHWDLYQTGDLYKYEEGQDHYSIAELKKFDYDKYRYEYLDELCAYCDVDNLLIIFMGVSTSSPEELFYLDDIHEQLYAIFKLDDISKEGFVIKINFNKEN